MYFFYQLWLSLMRGNSFLILVMFKLGVFPDKSKNIIRGIKRLRHINNVLYLLALLESFVSFRCHNSD